MSTLADKVPCKGGCGDLYDADLLNEQGICRDCKLEESFLADSIFDAQREGWLPEDGYDDEAG